MTLNRSSTSTTGEMNHEDTEEGWSEGPIGRDLIVQFSAKNKVNVTRRAVCGAGWMREREQFSGRAPGVDDGEEVVNVNDAIPSNVRGAVLWIGAGAPVVDHDEKIINIDDAVAGDVGWIFEWTPPARPIGGDDSSSDVERAPHIK
jgi:hypothetical protein